MASKTLTIKRTGIIGHSRNKKPFRAWLDEQPRKELTYKKDIERSDDMGWTIEDFCDEARKRGVNVRYFTAAKWASGVTPRMMGMDVIREAFKTIKF